VREETDRESNSISAVIQIPQAQPKVQCLAYLRRDAGGNKKKEKKKPTTTHLHTTQKCLTNANFLK
jgi:hypothetical protein